MLQLIYSNKQVLTSTIMVLIVLMEVAVPFTAEAQQQEIYVDKKELFKDRGKLKERLSSCIYEWKCFDDAEFKKRQYWLNFLHISVLTKNLDLGM